MRVCVCVYLYVFVRVECSPYLTILCMRWSSIMDRGTYDIGHSYWSILAEDRSSWQLTIHQAFTTFEKTSMIYIYI